MKQVPEVVCIGMVVVDVLIKGIEHIQMHGVTNMAESITLHPGGDAINEAVTLSRLGHGVSLLAQVGDDVQGRLVQRYCGAAGIQVEGLVVSDAYPTGTSVVLIQPDGEHGFIACPTHASVRYGLDAIDLDLLQEGTKVVSIASLFYSQLLNDPELTAILKKAKEIGAVTIADLVMDRADQTLDDIKTALSYLDYIVPSLDEGKHFTGMSDPRKIAETFLSYGVGTVVVKLGSQGAYALHDGQEYRVPTFATKVVDTTGAGDNFMAGFISGLVRGLSMEGCLRFGSGAAALSIGKVGATGAITSLEQVQDFVQKQ